MQEQKKFSVAVFCSIKIYINRNESVFKCFESMRKWSWKIPKRKMKSKVSKSIEKDYLENLVLV